MSSCHLPRHFLFSGLRHEEPQPLLEATRSAPSHLGSKDPHESPGSPSSHSSYIRGDGWSPGSWVKIETLPGETVVPENGLASGSEQTISFWVGPAPQAPPVSPPEPPAYPAHELVYVAALKSWDDAKTHCETSLDEGVGELVSIHTHEENELVLALCQDDCWIGLQNDTSARHAACAPLRSPPNTRV